MFIILMLISTVLVLCTFIFIILMLVLVLCTVNFFISYLR